MFGLFKKRPKSSSVSPDMDAILISSIKMIYLQLDLAGEKLIPEDDLYVLGYIFGFIDSTLSLSPIQQDHVSFHQWMNKAYTQYSLFPNGNGHSILIKSAQSQDDEHFMRGQVDGGSEYHEFMKKAPPPVGLSSHIMSAN